MHATAVTSVEKRHADVSPKMKCRTHRQLRLLNLLLSTCTVTLTTQLINGPDLFSHDLDTDLESRDENEELVSCVWFLEGGELLRCNDLEMPRFYYCFLFSFFCEKFLRVGDVSMSSACFHAVLFNWSVVKTPNHQP